MADNRVAGIFVGVDSGGTRTNVRVERYTADESRPVEQYSYESSDTLSGALPPELIPSTLRKIIAPLEIWLGRTDQSGRAVHVWISAAGFTPWTREAYLLAVKLLENQITCGELTSVGVANDAVSLLLGTRSDGIVIAGTGSSVILRDGSGRMHQSGGQEWVACDYGSGFWIGLRAIRRAYRDLENGYDSVLLQRLHEVYSVAADDTRGLVARLRELAVGDKDMKKDIAKFAASVCDAAERGDTDAQDTVKAEAEELADVTASAIRRELEPEDLIGGINLVQCGSLLNNQFYRGSFEAQLSMRLRSTDRNPTDVRWERTVTGDRAAARLARDLAVDREPFMQLDFGFRPVLYIK